MSPISTPAPAPTTSSTNQLFHDFLQLIHSRRLLLHTHLKYQPPPSANPPATTSEPYGATDNTFDANVVMILSVLLCALICSLGLNSIIKCALRCSTLVNSDNSSSPSSSSSSSSSSARIANTGIKKKALKTFLTFNYNAGVAEGVNQPGLDSECVICLSEFTSGERVRVLPKCNHCFHVRCIDKWLSSHSSCPTCRHCLLQTSQKIVQANSPAAPSLPPPPTVAITISPLEPEGIIANYREDRV